MTWLLRKLEHKAKDSDVEQVIYTSTQEVEATRRLAQEWAALEQQLRERRRGSVSARGSH